MWDTHKMKKGFKDFLVIINNKNMDHCSSQSFGGFELLMSAWRSRGSLIQWQKLLAKFSVDFPCPGRTLSAEFPEL